MWFKEPPIYDEPRLWDTIDVINEVAAAHGVSGAQVSLAWLLQRPLVATVIVGGRNFEQFEDNLKSVDLKLTADDIAKLDKVSQPPLIYPYWHQGFSVTSRLTEADLSLHRAYMED